MQNRDACGKCHAEGAKSAQEIPRVNMATHGEKYLCWQCHYPHQPEAR
jgi:ribosomal protein S27AE